MKLSEHQIKKLAHTIVDRLVQKKLLTPKVNMQQILAKIEGILLSDAKLEDDIDAVARKMMDKFRPQIESGEIDYHKMHTLVKKQIMKERKFTP